VVFLGKSVEKVELVTLFLSDLLVLVEEDWSRRELSQTLVTRAPLDSIVVAIQLGVGFLEQWHPPCTEVGTVSTIRNEIVF